MLGRYLEALARGKACNVVSSLRNEQATTARLLIAGTTESSGGNNKTDVEEQSVQEEREMDVEFIQPGDTIKVLKINVAQHNETVCHNSSYVSLCAPGGAWSQSRCRWRGDFRLQLGGRVAGHRRVHAGGQERRKHCLGWHHQSARHNPRSSD
jgi:hypothetical protein